jgi:ABC-type antimicrobial peptide transport system permease subunit
MAIRIAVGAYPGRIVAEVVGYGLRLALIGLLIGLTGALALTRVLTGLLHGLPPTDPVTYLGVAVLFCAVALSASWLPARRAARVEPMRILRTE